MDDLFQRKLFEAHFSSPQYPSISSIKHWFDQLLGLIFPEYCEFHFETFDQFKSALEKSESSLISILEKLNYDSKDTAEDAACFFKALPELKRSLDLDRSAMLSGDPAAKDIVEITKTYPGFYAIASYRIAHVFHKLNIPLLPRIITENAHSKAGIDIHPAAIIGSHFCIDHGTGIVIGETTEIGNHVKIYQGVTLGALSVEKSDAKTKRHPTIEDGVILYAGATILGGKTRIGKNSIVGGNVWLTKSVPANSKVYYQIDLLGKDGQSDRVTVK
ncbi:MAG: serine acetyltransferase [Flavobacteriales bacterium]|nr:serine acetyltransferase [Flavobacteriales bacterium]